MSCLDGYYFEGRVCMKCDLSCLTCEKNPKLCTKCLPGKVRRGHECLDSCGEEEYYDNID